MFSSSKSIIFNRSFDNYDYEKKFMSNFVFALSKINSDISISNIDRRVNAKSVLGLLSLAIKKDDVIRIDCFSSESVEKAQEDLHKVLEMIEVI